MFGVRRFHQFVYGRHFNLITDNVPLKHLFNQSKDIPHHANHRIPHWASELARYNFTIEHRKSELLIHVDALSRLPEQNVNNAIVMNLIDIAPKVDFPSTATQIAEASKKDPILSKVLNAVAGHWRLKASDENIRPFVQNLASLSILHDCLMFSNRVVIPLAFRVRVLELFHSGHPGVVRMKLKARSHVW